jgi:hypothetical protein
MPEESLSRDSKMILTGKYISKDVDLTGTQN